ncbi:Hypothetical predicted protein [Olea europaea subsp. europaea]|uniref:Uncharacterized protein n=1 Tax=Olea europaea subsp. europaea TaxID=158383 RepID=A0A8S0V9Y5_OLEEU|nr:Hypothetical predicted protein [Olea europaea subsp. europaea]
MGHCASPVKSRQSGTATRRCRASFVLTGMGKVRQRWDLLRGDATDLHRRVISSSLQNHRRQQPPSPIEKITDTSRQPHQPPSPISSSQRTANAAYVVEIVGPMAGVTAAEATKR